MVASLTVSSLVGSDQSSDRPFVAELFTNMDGTQDLEYTWIVEFIKGYRAAMIHD